jgi:hypothetical protein
MECPELTVAKSLVTDMWSEVEDFIVMELLIVLTPIAPPSKIP